MANSPHYEGGEAHYYGSMGGVGSESTSIHEPTQGEGGDADLLRRSFDTSPAPRGSQTVPGGTDACQSPGLSGGEVLGRRGGTTDLPASPGSSAPGHGEGGNDSTPRGLRSFLPSILGKLPPTERQEALQRAQSAGFAPDGALGDDGLAGTNARLQGGGGSTGGLRHAFGGSIGMSKSPLDRWQSLKTSVKLLTPSKMHLFKNASQSSHGGALERGSSALLQEEAAAAALPGWRRLLRAKEADQGEAEFAVASTVCTVVDSPHKMARVTVVRVRGGDEAATVFYTTKDIKHGARAGQDYELTQGELRFGDGEFSCNICVPILPNRGYQGSKTFEVVLTGADGGRLGEHRKTAVTILETDLRLYVRILDSPWFGLLTFLATAFTLVGASVSLVLFDKHADPAITAVTLACMLVFGVEMWALGWVKRWSYVLSTFFFMDVVALLGLFFFLPVLPRQAWGRWLGESNLGILAIARAARAARTGSQLGRAVPPVIKQFRRWVTRPTWRFLRKLLPRQVAAAQASEEQRAEEEEEYLDEMMLANKSAAPGSSNNGRRGRRRQRLRQQQEGDGEEDGGGKEGEGEEEEEGGGREEEGKEGRGKQEKGQKEGAKSRGVRDLVAGLLPSTSKISIAIVEFVVGRLILMMMLLLLVALLLLGCSGRGLPFHEASLAATAGASANSSTGELDFLVQLYARYVLSQRQAIVYLRINGQEISAARVRRLTCNETAVYPERMQSLRDWWMLVAAPAVPGVNGVSLLGDHNGGANFTELTSMAAVFECYDKERVDASAFRCPSRPQAAFRSAAGECGTLAILDNSHAEREALLNNLWLTCALVAILGVGAAVVAADAQSLFLSPLERMFSVVKFLVGNKDPPGRLGKSQRVQERRREREGKRRRREEEKLERAVERGREEEFREQMGRREEREERRVEKRQRREVVRGERERERDEKWDEKVERRRKRQSLRRRRRRKEGSGGEGGDRGGGSDTPGQQRGAHTPQPSTSDALTSSDDRPGGRMGGRVLASGLGDPTPGAGLAGDREPLVGTAATSASTSSTPAAPSTVEMQPGLVQRIWRVLWRVPRGEADPPEASPLGEASQQEGEGSTHEGPQQQQQQQQRGEGGVHGGWEDEQGGEPRGEGEWKGESGTEAESEGGAGKWKQQQKEENEEKGQMKKAREKGRGKKEKKEKKEKKKWRRRRGEEGEEEETAFEAGKRAREGEQLAFGENGVADAQAPAENLEREGQRPPNDRQLAHTQGDAMTPGMMTPRTQGPGTTASGMVTPVATAPGLLLPGAMPAGARKGRRMARLRTFGGGSRRVDKGTAPPHGAGAGPADGARCPGCPSSEAAAAAGGVSGKEKGGGADGSDNGGGVWLVSDAWARVSRLLAINQTDVRIIERELDKVERAFGWPLLEMRQWARDVIFWNDMAASLAASLSAAFLDESLTLGELRSKVALLYNSVRLPPWAAQSSEVRVAARLCNVAAAILGESLMGLQEQGLAVLRKFGVAVERSESVSVAMLTRTAIAAILRFDLLSKLGEPEPQGFAEYSLRRLWSHLVGVARRLAAGHLAAQGITVHASFWSVPLSAIWHTLQAYKTHALYHRLLAEGLQMGRAAALAKKKSELRRYARAAFKRSARALLEDFGVEGGTVASLALGGGQVAALRARQVAVRIARVPSVSRALAAEACLRPPLARLWLLLTAPLQECVNHLVSQMEPHGASSSGSSGGSNGAARQHQDRSHAPTGSSLRRLQESLRREGQVLRLWANQEVPYVASSANFYYSLLEQQQPQLQPQRAAGGEVKNASGGAAAASFGAPLGVSGPALGRGGSHQKPLHVPAEHALIFAETLERARDGRHLAGLPEEGVDRGTDELANGGQQYLGMFSKPGLGGRQGSSCSSKAATAAGGRADITLAAVMENLEAVLNRVHTVALREGLPVSAGEWRQIEAAAREPMEAAVGDVLGQTLLLKLRRHTGATGGGAGSGFGGGSGAGREWNGIFPGVEPDEEALGGSVSNRDVWAAGKRQVLPGSNVAGGADKSKAGRSSEGEQELLAPPQPPAPPVAGAGPAGGSRQATGGQAGGRLVSLEVLEERVEECLREEIRKVLSAAHLLVPLPARRAQPLARQIPPRGQKELHQTPPEREGEGQLQTPPGGIRRPAFPLKESAEERRGEAEGEGTTGVDCYGLPPSFREGGVVTGETAGARTSVGASVSAAGAVRVTLRERQMAGLGRAQAQEKGAGTRRVTAVAGVRGGSTGGGHGTRGRQEASRRALMSIDAELRYGIATLVGPPPHLFRRAAEAIERAASAAEALTAFKQLVGANADVHMPPVWPGTVSEAELRRHVERVAARWMFDALTTRGISPPASILQSAPCKAADVAQQLVLDAAIRRAVLAHALPPPFFTMPHPLSPKEGARESPFDRIEGSGRQQVDHSQQQQADLDQQPEELHHHHQLLQQQQEWPRVNKNSFDGLAAQIGQRVYDRALVEMRGICSSAAPCLGRQFGGVKMEDWHCQELRRQQVALQQPGNDTWLSDGAQHGTGVAEISPAVADVAGTRTFGARESSYPVPPHCAQADAGNLGRGSGGAFQGGSVDLAGEGWTAGEMTGSLRVQGSRGSGAAVSGPGVSKALGGEGGGEGGDRLERLVGTTRDEIVAAVGRAVQVCTGGGRVCDEAELAEVLHWLAAASPTAARIGEGILEASPAGLQVALREALDATAQQQNVDAADVAALCMRQLYAALDELLLKWARLEVEKLDEQVAPAGDASRAGGAAALLGLGTAGKFNNVCEDDGDHKEGAGVGQVARLALDLHAHIRREAREVYRQLKVPEEEVPADLPTMPDADFVQLSVQVALGNVPQMAALLDALALVVPAGDGESDDMDAVTRFIVNSGYPARWQAFLPLTTQLAPLQDVLRAPRANLAVIALQVVAHLLLMGTERNAPPFFDAVGSMGRGALAWLRHVVEIYEAQEEQQLRRQRQQEEEEARRQKRELGGRKHAPPKETVG